jgi:hypothetical protein
MSPSNMIASCAIRIGLVARICRSHSSKEEKCRQGRGSIPRFGKQLFACGFEVVVNPDEDLTVSCQSLTIFGLSKDYGPKLDHKIADGDEDDYIRTTR